MNSALSDRYTTLSRRFLGLAALLLCGTVYRADAAPPSQDETGRLTITGLVTAQQQSTLSARMPSRIVTVLVQDNQLVRKGQAVIQLDDTDMQAQLNSARAALQSAKTQSVKARVGKDAQRAKADADILSAKNGLADARQKQKQADLALMAAVSENGADLAAATSAQYKARQVLDRAIRTVEDLEQLDKVGGVARNDLDAARLQKNLAESDYNAATEAIARVKSGPNGVPFKIAAAKNDVALAAQGVKVAETGLSVAISGGEKLMSVAEADIRSANSGVDQAQVGVSSALSAVHSMRLTSPLDAVATAVNARAGEIAQPGMPLITLVSQKNLKIEALILTRQLPGIRTGQHAVATVDSQPGKAFDVVVSELSSVVEADQRSIKIRFRFVSPATLRPGLSARITLNITHR